MSTAIVQRAHGGFYGAAREIPSKNVPKEPDFSKMKNIDSPFLY